LGNKEPQLLVEFREVLPAGKPWVRTPETQALALPWELGPRTSCRQRKPRLLASLWIFVLGGARPSVPCSPTFSIWSRSVAGDADGEAEDRLRARAVGLCGAGIRNALDGAEHGGTPSDEPGMPVCGLPGCCRSWGTTLPLLPCLLPPSSAWVKHLRGFGSWLVENPAQDCQTSRFPGTPWAF